GPRSWHRAGGSGGRVRGVPAGRNSGKKSGGHRAWPRHLPQVHRAARRKNLGKERTRDWLDVRVHVAADGRSTPADGLISERAVLNSAAGGGKSRPGNRD